MVPFGFNKRTQLSLILIALFGIQQAISQNCSVNAGVEEVYCENIASINLSGSIAGPTVSGSTWTQIGGPSVLIADPSDPTTAISGLVGGNTYTFRLTAECTIGGVQFQDVDIVVQPVTTADAGANIESCPDSSGSLTLNANAPSNIGEVGEWSVVGANSAGVSINNINSPTSFITLPSNRAGSTTLRWTITGPDYEAGQFCESSDTVTITNYGGEPAVSAGSDQTLDNCYTIRQSTVLNASFGGNNINGQVGTWSFVSGPTTPDFSNVNRNNSFVSNLIQGTYVLRWTVDGSCASGVDTMTITVPTATQELTTASVQDDEIRFCDPGITSTTLTGSQPLFTGETVQWTQVSGSTTGISILNPTNNTTQVTGLDSNETYVFRYTITNGNTGCTDFDDVTIRYAPNPISIIGNSSLDVFGACGETTAEIPFATTGEGSNTYAIISGPSGSSIINPSFFQNTGSAPLTINFDVEGTYSVLLRRAVSGSIQTGCEVATDIVNVTIALTPSNSNAGTDQQLLCNVTTTTITGNAPPTGSSLWSQISGPSTATIVSPYDRSTDIEDLIPGAYVFQYLITGGNVCSPAASDTLTVLVSSDTAVPTEAGPDQNLLCYGAPVQMAADPAPLGSLIGTWSVESQPTGSSVTFQDINDANTLVFGLEDANETYEFRWTVGNPNDLTCPIPGFDTITVTTNNTEGPTTANAGVDQCESAGTTVITLDGNEPQPGETGTWSVTPSTGVSFADANLFNTSVTISSDDSYIFTWTIDKAGCQSTFDSVEITVGPAATADAGLDQTACSDTFTMAATSSTGSGLWSLVSGPGGATIADETSPTTTISFLFSGVYTFEWTVNNGSCSTASDQVTLEVGIPPTIASVGATQEVCLATSTTLTGNSFDPDIETGFWSVLPGAPNTPTFTNINDPSSDVSNLVTGSYTFRWTILGGTTCPTTFADLQVDVFAPVGDDETFNFCDVTNFLVEATFGATGTWAQTAGPTAGVTIDQSPINSNVAEINIAPGATYEFTFTADYTCNPDTKTVTVVSSAAPSVLPDAGPDQVLCLGDLAVANQTTLAGNASSGNVTSQEWRFSEVPSGSTATIDDPTNPTSTLSNLSTPGTYILEWNFAAGNCSDTSDIVRIEVSEAPTTADAGVNQTNACQLDVQLAANNPTAGIGTWSFDTDPSGGAAIIDSPNSPTSTLSNITVTGTYVLTWTIENPNTSFVSPSACAPSTDTVSITFLAPAPSEAEAGSDQAFCDATATTLGATPLVTGTGTWSQTAGPGVDDASPAAIIASANDPTSSVSNLQPGTYEFTWTVTNGGCTLTDTMTVDITAQPVSADAGPDQLLSRFESATLNAVAPTIGTGVWTQISGPSTASFVDNTNPNTALLGTVDGTYVFQWTVTNGPICTQESDTVEISFVGVDMELTKTVSPTLANIGDSVTFTIALFNNDATAASDATGIAVRDVVPDGFSLVPGTISNGGSYNPGNLTIDWTNLTISNGSTLNLTFEATINTNGSYDNSAQIISGDIIDIDSNFDNNVAAEDDQDNAVVTIRTADVRLTKTISPAIVSIGETVTFSLRARNNGPDTATGVSIRDIVPSGYTIQTINNGGSQNGNEIEWSGLTVATGTGTTVTYTATVNAPTGNSDEYLNVAEISANEVLDPDSSPNNDDGDQSEDDEDSAFISLEVTDLELNITNNATTGNIGDTIGYNVSVFNNDTVETGDATGIEVVVIVPSGMDIVTGSITNGGIYNPGSGSITWSGIDIANGSTLDLNYQVTINNGGSYNTTGEITASDLPDADSTPNNDDGDQSEDDEDIQSFVLQSADLSLDKSVSPTAASVGDTVTFTLEVSNAGTDDATGVAIEDVVPVGYTIVTINNGGIQSSNSITWSGLSVTDGGATSVSFSATLNAPTGTTNEYLNTAQIIASDQNDPDSSTDNDDGDQSEDDEDSATVTLEEVDLQLDITNNTATGNIGDTVDYTVSVFNNDTVETGDASGVDVVVAVPLGMNIVTGSITNGGVYNPGSGTITWSGLNITNGATLDLDYQVTINDSGSYNTIGEITASDLPDADSTPNNDDGDQSEDDEDIQSFVLQSADLSLDKSVSPTAASVGDTVTFTLEVSNAGTDDATGVAIEDVVPVGYTIVTINNGGIQSSNSITWSGLSVTDGGSTSVSFTATLNPPTGATNEYLNTAQIIASDQSDPDSETNNDDGDQSEDDEDSTTVTLEQVDLQLDITNNTATGNVGDNVTYTVDLFNDDTVQTGDATGVDVVVNVPSGLTIVTGSISNGGVYNTGSGTITWSDISVNNGDTESFTYTVMVNSTGNFDTTGQVTASDLPDADSIPNNDDGDQSEDDEDVQSFTLQSADLSLVKNVSAASSGTPNIGDTVIFELTITNAGPDTATNITLEDEIPSGLNFVSINNGGTAIAVPFLNWDIPSLPVGSTTVSYEVTVSEPSGFANEYLNIAEIAASDQDDPDSEPFNDDGDQSEDDEDFFVITPQVIDLELDINVSDSNPNVGEVVTFTIDISNLGDVLATGVSIEDLLPTGFGNITGISNGGTEAGGVISWSGLTVPVGSDTLTLTFDAEVLAPTGVVDEYLHITQSTAADQFDVDSTPNNDDGNQSEDDEDGLSIIPQQADLSLEKSVSDSTPDVGSTVTFTLTITNLGPNVATGVALEDVLPSGFTLTTVNNGGVGGGNTASWTGLTILANGGNTSVTYEATVNAPTGAPNEYQNSALITASDQFDPDSDPTTGNTVDEDGDGNGDDDDEDTLTVTPNIGDLELTKIVVDGDTTPLVDSEISFEITVFNVGGVDADNVVVEDLLPSGYDFVLYSATSGIYNENTGVWQVGDVSAGGTETLVIDVLVNTTGVYTNVAEVTAASIFDIDSTPNNNVLAEDDQDDVIVTPIEVADLALTKTVDTTTPDVNGNVVFTITVTNEGPSEATGIEVSDQIPSGFSYVTDDSGGAFNSGTGIWNIPNLANGANAILNITANVNTTGDYINRAEVVAHDQLDEDSTPNNTIPAEDDQDEVIITPRQLVDISLTKTADIMTPNVGGNIIFTLTVTNDGPSDASAVVVTDLLESGYDYVTSTPSVGTYEPLNGSWTIGDLADGITETMTIEATVLANGIYTNTAELTDLNEDDIDSLPANNDDTEDDQETIEPTPILVSDLELTKTVDDATPLVGDTIEFTINVTNNGPSDTSGVVITDLLPSGYTYISHNTTAGLYDENNGVWNVNGTLPNGTTETLEIQVSVNPTGDYMNTAEITASDNLDVDSTPNNGVNTEDDFGGIGTTPIPVADLSLTKSVDNEFPDVSDQITFTLTLDNAGPSDATGIQVADALPFGYAYVSDDSGGTYDPSTGIWNVASLAADASAVLNITVTINTNGSYLNEAELIAVNELDPNSMPNNNVSAEDDQDEQVTLPRVITDISVVKSADNLAPSVGSTITFTVTVNNDGPSDATGLVIEDVLASGYNFISATPSVGLYDEVIGSWDIASLTNGTTETLVIVATVLSNGDYSNTAELIALDTFDPDSSPDNNLNSEDDQDTVNPVPTGLADLSLTKTVDNETPNVGDIIEFTINLTNSGDSNATGVVVSEIMPIGFTYVTHTATAGIYDENTGIWNTNGVIPNGTTETLIVLATVNAPTGVANEYTNQVQITESDQIDPDSDANEDLEVDDLNDGLPDDDEAVVVVTPQSVDVALQKTVDNPRPNIGDEIIFTIMVTNNGVLQATNIGIEETLPNGYRFISANTTNGTYDASEGFWELDALNGTETATLTILVEVLDIEDYENVAQLAFMDQFDNNESNDIATATIEPTCLVFYNEFSPNGDGVNETFVIDCISRYPNNTLKIYNRWGNIVYEKQGYFNEFDGTSNGRAVIQQEEFLPVGTYYYILDLGDGSEAIADWLYINR